MSRDIVPRSPRRARLGLALGLTLAVAPAARAGVLYTSPAIALEFNDSQIFCQVRNTGTSSVTVTTDLLAFGSILVESDTVTLPPGAATSVGPSGGSSAFCRFTTTGSPKRVRAAAIYHDGTRYTLAIPAR